MEMGSPRARATRLQRNPDIVLRTVAHQTFLLPVRGDLVRKVEMFVLSDVARFIWDRVDGERGVEELAAEVVREFTVDEEQARADVAEFVADLLSNGLLTGEA